MKKILSLSLIIVIAVLSMGFSNKLPLPEEGVYPLKLRTLTYFDLASKEFPLGSNLAEVMEVKPDYLTVHIDNQLTAIQYGFFKLGNHDQKVWFCFGKNPANGQIEFYIDQNADNQLVSKEKVESMETFNQKSSGFTIEGHISLIPVGISVSYRGINNDYLKKLFFFISLEYLTKKGNTDLRVEAVTASFLEGEMTVLAGKTEKQMKIRLMDINGNGCFNDYGKDLIYIDINADEYFRKRESQPITEFYDFPGTNANRQKRQLRMIVLPMPAKIAVVGATADFDRSSLEPASDPAVANDAATNETAVAPNLKPTVQTDSVPAASPQK